LEGGVQTSPEEERAKIVALFGKSDEEEQATESQPILITPQHLNSVKLLLHKIKNLNKV